VLGGYGYVYRCIFGTKCINYTRCKNYTKKGPGIATPKALSTDISPFILRLRGSLVGFAIKAKTCGNGEALKNAWLTKRVQL